MLPTSNQSSITAPVALLRRGGDILGWSSELERLSGRPSDQAVGRPLRELIVTLDPSELPNLSQLSPGQPWSGSIAWIPTDGRIARPCRAELATSADTETLELRCVRPALGGYAALDGPARADVQQLEALLEHLPGFCYTVNADLVFTSSRGGGLRCLNLMPGQLVGTNLLDMWRTREPSYEPFLCHLKALAGVSTTYQDVCLERSLEYHLRPLLDASANIVGVIGVGFDVTERERAREQQARLTAQLRQAQKMEAIGRLAGGVAHDFNNFLTCIMGNLSLLEDKVVKEPAPRAYLAEANAAVDSAAALTRQLLTFSRKQVISPRPISLSALIERITGILERLVGDRITLSTRCAPDLWSVNADPGQIEQILVNLVVNARDAITDEGEIAICTRNMDLTAALQPFEALARGSYVVLSVEDSGRGMSDVVRAKLFEPFFTTKEAGAGTGLGLATVYGAVQQNGGAISVDSELGSGSKFHIYLPRVDAPMNQDSAPVLRPSTSSLRVSGGTETILLVEDEPSVLELGHCTLQQLGYNVLPCASPDEALRTFSVYQQRIDLLVTDVVMPRMSGKELAARIVALSPGIPVLFSSGYGESIIAKQGVIDPGVHFIAKPYRPRELAAKVRALLDHRAGLSTGAR